MLYSAPVSTAPKLFAAALLALAACNSAPIGVDAGYLSWSPPGVWLTAPAGGQASAAVTITNSGDLPANVTSIAVTGASRPVFTVSGTSLAIAVGGDAGVTVVYAPQSCPASGDDSADITFVTDSSDAPSFELPLVGICTGGAGVDAGVDAG